VDSLLGGDWPSSRLMFRLHRTGPVADVLDDHLVVFHHNLFTTIVNTFWCTNERGLLHSPRTLAQNVSTPSRSRSSAVRSVRCLGDFPHPSAAYALGLQSVGGALASSFARSPRLIGIDQAGHFSVEGGELALQAYAFLFRPESTAGSPSLFILRPQHVRIDIALTCPDTRSITGALRLRRCTPGTRG